MKKLLSFVLLFLMILPQGLSSSITNKKAIRSTTATPRVTSKLAPTATPKPTAVPTDKPTARPKPASSYNVTYSGTTTYLVQDAEKLFASLEPFSDVLTTDRKTYTKVAYYTEEYGLVESLAALYKEALESYSSMELTASITDKYSSQWYIYTLPNASSDDKFSYSITRSGSGEKDYQGSLFITYNPDGTKIQFFMAKSLSVKDLGLRVSASQIEKLSNLGYEDDSSSSSASSSSNSSSAAYKREKNCPKVDCNNGKVDCSNCDGKGYQEKRVFVPNYSGKGAKYETFKEACYRCHGSGDVDCSTCDGDGKVEY